MKNNFEGYLDLFKDLLTRATENEKMSRTVSNLFCFVPTDVLVRIIKNQPSFWKCKMFGHSFINDIQSMPLLTTNVGQYTKILNNTISDLKNSFDYSKFSSYESGEKIRNSSIQEFQTQINILNALCDIHNALVPIAKNIFTNFEKTLSTLVEFLKAIRNYKESKTQIETYKFYGLACEVLRTTTATFNLKDSGTDKKVEEILSEAFGTIEGFDINKDFLFLVLIRRQLELMNELFSYGELLVVIRCAEKIVETDVLPEKLRYKEAADTIADYFMNRRVSNEKEAINLYYQELAAKEAADKAFAEEQKEREMFNKQLMSIINLIEDNISQQNANTAFVMETVNKATKEYVKDYNNLVDEHNALVDKHNALVDEIKRRG